LKVFFLRSVLTILSLILIGCATSTEINSDLSEAIGWYTGAAGFVDDERAKNLLEQAAATQDTLAVMWIARVHSTGRMGFEENRELAQQVASSVIQEVERLAIDKNAEAMFLMGTAYAEGLGKPIDHEMAAYWYERAAQMGNMLAQHNMGNIYESGTGVPQNDSLAVNWWQKAAEQGDAIPQFRFAVMLEEGRGIDPDLEEAMRWYEESARRGYIQGQAALDRLGQSSRDN